MTANSRARKSKLSAARPMPTTALFVACMAGSCGISWYAGRSEPDTSTFCSCHATWVFTRRNQAMPKTASNPNELKCVSRSGVAGESRLLSYSGTVCFCTKPCSCQ